MHGVVHKPVFLKVGGVSPRGGAGLLQEGEDSVVLCLRGGKLNRTLYNNKAEAGRQLEMCRMHTRAVKNKLLPKPV